MWGMFVHKDGGIWDFDSRLTLTPVAPDTMWARGSGGDFALGADHVAKAAGQSAEARMKSAVAAAMALDISCPGAPIIERFVPIPMPQTPQTSDAPMTSDKAAQETATTDAPKDEVTHAN